jgi:hypothetical protein
MTVLFNLEALILGVALIALGVVWMLANLGHLDLLATLHRWWPSLLVLWGSLELARSWQRRRARGER